MPLCGGQKSTFLKTDEKGAANLDNKKQIRRRILIFTVSVLFIFSLFAVDLFRIQIVNAADYSTQRVALSETKSTIAASRGEILDCNGTPLVTNEQINSVVLNASYFPSTKEQDKRNEIILSLINLLESEGTAWNDNLPLVLNSDGSVSFKENADKDITYLKSKDVLYLNSPRRKTASTSLWKSFLSVATRRQTHSKSRPSVIL